MRTQDVLAADMVLTDDWSGLIGPLTLPAVVELLFRVKTLSIEGSYTSSVDGAVIVPSTEVFTRPPSITEAGILQSLAKHDAEYSSGYEGGHLAVFGGPVEGPAFGDFNYELGSGTRTHMVAKDETGAFWLFPVFNFSYVATGVDIQLYTTTYYATGEIQVSVTLRLNCGDFPIVMQSLNSDLTAASIVLKAAEWWPYAVTDGGLPFWDSDTGLMVNHVLKVRRDGAVFPSINLGGLPATP